MVEEGSLAFRIEKVMGRGVSCIFGPALTTGAFAGRTKWLEEPAFPGTGGSNPGVMAETRIITNVSRDTRTFLRVKDFGNGSAHSHLTLVGRHCNTESVDVRLSRKINHSIHLSISRSYSPTAPKTLELAL